MERIDILNKVVTIFQQVLDDDELDLTEATSLEELEDWNSLNNSMVIALIEEQFGFKFKLYQLEELDTIRDFIDAITDRGKKF